MPLPPLEFTDEFSEDESDAPATQAPDGGSPAELPVAEDTSGLNQAMLAIVRGKTRFYPRELEANFPRIFSKILDAWQTPDIEDLLNELMIDNRGGNRKGFPEQVVREILQLSQIYEQHYKQAESSNDPWADVDRRRALAIESLGFKCTPQDFLKATELNNREVIGKFLSSGFPVETKDERDWTLLIIAASNGSEEIVELLLRSGANINARDKGGYSALHWAAYNGKTDVVRLLIEKEADVNAASQYGWTPLMQAAARGHLPTCGALIAGGANVNLTSHDGWTPLHKACANGHIKVARLLLAAGCDKHARYQDGTTAMEIAASNGHTEIATLLGQDA